MEYAEKYRMLMEQGKYDEANQLHREAFDRANDYIDSGLTIDEAFQKAGFTYSKKLHDFMEEVAKQEIAKNPYFLTGKPFEDIKKEDEELDNYLMVKGFTIDNFLVNYYKDLSRFNVGELLDKIGLGLKGLFELLSDACKLINENSNKPIFIQNKIIDFLDSCNKTVGGGQVVQILILQGLNVWIKDCNIKEGNKSYKEVESLHSWICEKLIEVCLFYFYHFDKDENSEPLDNYLASTEVGRCWRESQEDELSISESAALPKELDTDKAKELLHKAITAGLCDDTQSNIKITDKKKLPSKQNGSTKRGRSSKPFKEYLQNGDKLHALYSVMDGKTGKEAALVMKVAIQIGWITKPTFKAVADEFGDIGNRSNYNKFLNEDRFTKDEVAGMQNILSSYYDTSKAAFSSI